MKGLKKNNHFEEKFQDSEANYSETGEYKVGENREEQAGGYPIQLIKIKQNGKIEISQDALNIIAQYNSPIGFVALVGKMRTGKSCLLNRLLGLTGKGFKVDPSTSSCTQGIWMWSVPQFNYQKNNYIFYLDTEGTDSLEKDTTNDTKIFTLSLLIATYFIYNSVGSIDQRSLSEIEMITALSKQIKTDQKLSDRDNQQNLYRYMPKFLWVLRDFTLKIQDEKGRKISATQYLQNCLSDQSHNEKVNENARKIKKSIMNYFKDRQCITLVRPVGDENQLQKLNSIPDHAIRKQFIEGINILHTKILKNTLPKTYEGELVTGPAMVSMIESYVEAFNSDQVPNIKSAWQQISENQGAAAYNKALQRYEQIFREEFPDDVPKGEEIYRVLGKLKDETLKQFTQNLYQDKNEEYLNKLKEIIKQKEVKILQINTNLNELKNQKILEKYAKKIETKKESGAYKRNKDQLLSDIKDMTDKYNSEAKGETKGSILTQYILDLTNYMQSLQQKTSPKDEEEKRKAQIKLDQIERQNKIQKSQIDSLKQQLIAKQSAQALNANKVSKVRGGKEEKKQAGGCCSGDKCQIM